MEAPPRVGVFADVPRKRRTEMSDRMRASQWSLSEDRSVDWTTTTTKEFPERRRGTTEFAERRRVNMNASDAKHFFPVDKDPLPASERFTSETAKTFDRTSTVRRGFVRARPAPEFDRATAATRPTASIVALVGGDGTELSPAEWRSTIHAHHATPSSLPVPDAPHYKPRQDGPRTFDLVTGMDKRGESLRHPVAGKPTMDIARASATRTAAYDILTGTIRPRPTAPPRIEDVARAAPRPPLATLAALRPPTPTGTDYYSTYRR